MILHIYDDGSDIVIAESAEAASELLTEFVDDMLKPPDWVQKPDDQPYVFCDDENDETLESTKLASEWVALKGRGYMGSYYR